jgi:ketosteroid isomerase-like protein
MSAALELLEKYLAQVGSPSAASQLFSADGAIELPYLESIGLPWRVEGPEAIESFLVYLLQSLPDFAFRNVRHHIITPDQVFSEYDVETLVQGTGRIYKQSYAGRLVAENGKIKLLRESLDTVRVAQAMFPDGLSGLPPHG